MLLELNDLTKPEKEILLAGSLINSYQNNKDVNPYSNINSK